MCGKRFVPKGSEGNFFAYLDKVKGSAVTRMRLEVEEDNTRAVALYEKTWIQAFGICADDQRCSLEVKSFENRAF